MRVLWSFLVGGPVTPSDSKILKYELGLVADPVIEAIVRLEFEDGLRTGVLLGGCWGP